MKPPVSVIVPVFAHGERRQMVLARLADVLAACQHPYFELVIADASPDGAAAPLAAQGKYDTTYVTVPCGGEVFSPGLARDAGAQQARGEYLLFYDVDLVHPPDLLPRLVDKLEWLARNPLAFVMMPCLYLRPEATRRVEQDAGLIRRYWLDYLRGDFSGTVSLAVASSAILLKRATYLAAGGHRPEFSGHGCEDLELINRLCLDWPLGERFPDHCADLRQDSIAGSRGFRRYFAYYGLPAAFEGLVVAHRWHGRSLASRYVRSRPRNDRLLAGFLRAADGAGDAPPALPDLTVRERTAVVLGMGQEDAQAFRQLLPELGRYKVVATPEELRAGSFSQCFFIGIDGPDRILWQRSAGFAGRSRTLVPAGGRPDEWHLTLRDAGGRPLRRLAYTGVRRAYGGGAAHRWVFHRAVDRSSGKTLFDFAPPPYAQPPQLPPLDAYLRTLMAGAGYAPEQYPGPFRNQWADAPAASRLARKLRKLVRDPVAFVRDSKLISFGRMTR